METNLTIKYYCNINSRVNSSIFEKIENLAVGLTWKYMRVLRRQQHGLSHKKLKLLIYTFKDLRVVVFKLGSCPPASEMDISWFLDVMNIQTRMHIDFSYMFLTSKVRNKPNFIVMAEEIILTFLTFSYKTLL